MKAHYRRRLILRLVFSTAACVLIAGATFLFYRTRQDAPFEHFVDSAEDAHLRYVRGTLDLDFRSEEGPVVSAWLGERLPFQTALPKHPAQPVVRSRYTLVGARVLPFEDHNLGYVAYQMQGKPISLLISSAAVVRPSGGQVYRSGALLFHFFSRDGLQLIAWMDRGLSYALVSDVQVSGAESCVVCHGSDTERQKFENLAPLPEGAITPKP